MAMLNDIMLSVVMLNLIMLYNAAPVLLPGGYMGSGYVLQFYLLINDNHWH